MTRADWAAGSPGSPPLIHRFASGCMFRSPWIAESEDARRICRFISRYVIGYFPVTLHVEDYDAFDPTRAYGELILTISFPFLGGRILVSCVFSRFLKPYKREKKRAEKLGVFNRTAGLLVYWLCCFQCSVMSLILFCPSLSGSSGTLLDSCRYQR